MGPERAVGAGFTSSFGLSSYRSMVHLQNHQLRAQRQQQQQQQQHQQAGPFSVDPSGMSGPHALLTSGPPQLWPGNTPVRSAAQAASEAAAQATAAAEHLRGPAAYSHPFKIIAADAAGRLPHGIAAQVQQQEQLHQAKCVAFPAAGANAASADRPQNPAAAEGTGAANDIAFAGDVSELRQHWSRQIPPKQISEVPAASTAAAAQPDQVDNTRPDSSAGVGVHGHLPDSNLAEQHETLQVRMRKRDRLGQWEAAATSASQHDRFSEGAQPSGIFKLAYGPRLLPQGSDEHLNVQPQGTVGHLTGQIAGAMPPPAPRHSVDRGMDRRPSQDDPAINQDLVSRSMRLIERSREKRMPSSEDDLSHRQPSGLQRPSQAIPLQATPPAGKPPCMHPPCASDQQPVRDPCNKGPTPPALVDGAGSTHMWVYTAEGRT